MRMRCSSANPRARGVVHGPWCLVQGAGSNKASSFWPDYSNFEAIYQNDVLPAVYRLLMQQLMPHGHRKTATPTAWAFQTSLHIYIYINISYILDMQEQLVGGENPHHVIFILLYQQRYSC